jgi:ABC-type spermidine/putrescine transport system permease subunit I
MNRSKLGSALLLAPGLVILVGLLVLPITLMAVESFRPYVPGRAGSGSGWTLANYAELANAAYAFYYWDTFRIGLIVSLLGIAFGAPIAWLAARTKRHGVRLFIFGLLIGLLFLSLIARLYAIQMAWGATGPMTWFGDLIGIPVRSPRYAEVQVIIGLLHFVLPLNALVLIGTFQNINPRLEDAAASLGAPRWRVAWDVTLPLALPGLASAFSISLAMCVSNFVVPLILGRGVVLFTTNLMYTRFSDVANYPSGAAIGILMLLLAFAIIYLMSLLVRRWTYDEAAR